jgi:hypothetical protein
MRPGSPTQSDVYDWLLRHPEFAEMYTVARERQQDMRGDEIVDISDDVSQTESMARVQAARLQVDSRKWVMSKLAPRKYGDKLELTGAGGGPVMFVTGVVRAGDGARDVTPSIEAQPSDDVGE